MADVKLMRSARVYERVVERLKDSIARGDLEPGDPLPSERKLIEDLGVSRSSLREAFRVMELLGLIDSVPGKGRYVRQPSGVSENTASMRLEDSAILELMEARRVLDPAIAAESAMKATAAEITHLLRLITLPDSTICDPDLRARADFNFHIALAEATHNFVFVNITRMNFNLIMATHDRIYSLLEDKNAFLREHRGIYEAILDRDVDIAREMATRHINRIYRTLHRGIANGGRAEV